jgi:hypothetical protein
MFQREFKPDSSQIKVKCVKGRTDFKMYLLLFIEVRYVKVKATLRLTVSQYVLMSSPFHAFTYLNAHVTS